MWSPFSALFAEPSKPTLEFNIWAKSETKYTPDILFLEQYDFQLIFVYDEFRRNHRHNQKLGLDFICNAFTKDYFSLWKKKLGRETSAIMLESRFNTVPSYPVQGEIYKIRPQQFLELDTMKENGVCFYRKRITLDVPYRTVKWTKERGVFTTEEELQRIKAWTYIGIPDYWNPIIDGGYSFGIVNHYSSKKPWVNSYYSFTPKEYKD